MLPQLPYPELIDRDSQSPDFCHIAKTKSVFACGTPRDPSRPIAQISARDVECVVCEDIWQSEGPWTV